MKSWGAQLASEKQQRDLMKTQLNEIEVESEAVPFSFEMKREGRELRPAAMGFVQDLKALIFCLLEENSR